MSWLLHAMVGGLVGLVVNLVVSNHAGLKGSLNPSRNVQAALIGALSAGVAGAVWAPMCQSFVLESPLRVLAPFWSVGIAMVAVIGGAELRRRQ